MTRRLALAVALAFTTVVTFALVAIGAQAGLFGDGGKDGAPAEASVGETATPTGQTPAAEPTVVTEYIYIDQTVTPSPSGAPSQDSSGSAGNTSQAGDSEDGDSEEIEEHAPPSPSDDDHDVDDDHEREHEESEHEEDDD